MKVSKLVALIGVALVSVFSTGCLQGPVADGGFSVFPEGVYFNGQNS